MLFTKFTQDLEKGEPDKFYFISGEEQFLHQKARELLKIKIIPPGSEDFDLEILDGAEFQFDRFYIALRSLPMMSLRRLVIIKSFNEIDGRQYSRIIEAVKKELRANLILILCYEDKPVFKEKSTLSELRDLGTWVDVSSPRSNEFVKLLKYLSPERQVDANLAGFLAESGVDLWQISIWFQQAVSLTDENEKLTLENMGELVDLGGTANLWRLEDAVGERNLEKAQLLLCDLGRNKEKPASIMWRLKDLFIHLNLMCQIRRRGAAPEEYRTKIGKEIHAFRFNKYSRMSKNFSAEEVENALLRIQQTDLNLKTSSGDPDAMLIELVDGIIGRKQNPSRL